MLWFSTGNETSYYIKYVTFLLFYFQDNSIKSPMMKPEKCIGWTISCSIILLKIIYHLHREIGSWNRCPSLLNWRKLDVQPKFAVLDHQHESAFYLWAGSVLIYGKTDQYYSLWSMFKKNEAELFPILASYAFTVSPFILFIFCLFIVRLFLPFLTY